MDHTHDGMYRYWQSDNHLKCQHEEHERHMACPHEEQETADENKS